MKTGTWITITFSFQDIVTLGACQGPLSEVQISAIVADSELFITELSLEVIFDDDRIDVLTNLRADKITTVNNNAGDCQYIPLFRYYVRPQLRGVHAMYNYPWYGNFS